MIESSKNAAAITADTADVSRRTCYGSPTGDDLLGLATDVAPVSSLFAIVDVLRTVRAADMTTWAGNDLAVAAELGAEIRRIADEIRLAVAYEQRRSELAEIEIPKTPAPRRAR